MSGSRAWRAAPWVAIILLAYPALWLTSLYDNIPLGHIGDYSFDTRPGLNILLDGEFWKVYGLTPPPLMFPLPLIIQAIAVLPFNALGIELINWPGLDVAADTKEGVTQFGIASLAVLMISTGVIWLTTKQLLRLPSQRALALSGVIIAAFILLNPVATGALFWGHPEEILMAAFLCGAFTALARGEWIWSAVWLGLAVATKQPALLFVPAAVLTWPREARLKSFGVFAAVAVLISAPLILPQLSNVISQQLAVSAPNALEGLASFKINIYEALGVSDWLAWSSRPIIFGAAIFLPLGLAGWGFRKQLPTRKLLPAICLIALVRIWFDPYNIVYYALPLLVGLLVLELYQWREGAHPLQRLAPKLTVPLPLITITSMTAYGLVTSPNQISTSLYDGFGTGAIGAVLVILPLLAWLVWLLIRGLDARVSGRLIGGVAAAYALLTLVVVIAPGFRSTGSDVQPAPPDGYEAVPLEKAAQAIAPQRVYQLSPDTSEKLELPNRFEALRGDIPLFNNTVGPAKSSKPLTFADYGPSYDGLRGVSVFTFLRKDSKPYEILLRKCAEGVCPADTHMEEGPRGELMVTQAEPTDPWEAREQIKGQIVYVLILHPEDYPPEEVMRGIEPVRVSGPGSGACSAECE